MSSFILTMRNVNYLGEIMQDEELICFILTMRNVNQSTLSSNINFKKVLY